MGGLFVLHNGLQTTPNLINHKKSFTTLHNNNPATNFNVTQPHVYYRHIIKDATKTYKSNSEKARYKKNVSQFSFLQAKMEESPEKTENLALAVIKYI